jgi:hypothetical protein
MGGKGDRYNSRYRRGKGAGRHKIVQQDVDG